MSKRDVRLFLNDMMESIEKIEQFTAGLTLKEFEQRRPEVIPVKISF